MPNHTIHPVTDTAPDMPQMFALVTGDGDPYLIGEWHELIDLHAALTNAIAGNLAEPIDRLDPAWGNHYSIARAVQEAISYGYGNSPITVDPAQVADTIRAAARNGRIRGAVHDPAGRWTVPASTFRGWLVRSLSETRGRPKQQAVEQ